MERILFEQKFVYKKLLRNWEIFWQFIHSIFRHFVFLSFPHTINIMILANLLISKKNYGYSVWQNFIQSNHSMDRLWHRMSFIFIILSTINYTRDFIFWFLISSFWFRCEWWCKWWWFLHPAKSTTDWI